MTCKDCLHYNAHKHYFATPDYEKDFDDYFNCNGVEYKCPEFLDKSAWVHLPCKVGDTAYLIENDAVREITIEVVEFECDADEIDYYISNNWYGGYLGTTVFLTRKEAEKALEERRAKHYDA